MNAKKLLALLLAVVMVVSVFAGCDNTKPEETKPTETKPAETKPAETQPTEPPVVTFEGDYTYTDWVTTLSALWNPHTYETSDQSYPIGYLTNGFYNFIFNDELNPVEGKDPYEGYVIVPEMAAELPVDVTEAVKAEHPEFGIPESATEGYAYKIALNPLACWEDGTPITADDYVESMKRLLDPKLQNYRAGGYYEGGFEIAGAAAYANAGLTVKNDNGVTAAYTIETLVKGEDGLYTTAEGEPVYIAVAYALDWTGGKTLKDYVDAYGASYFGMEKWADLLALADENGLVPCNDENLALLASVTTTNANWGETEADLPNYLVYDQTYPEVGYETVGLYKTGDYEITLVLAKSLAGFNLWYNLTSNWLVKTDLYDACLSNENGAWTSTYNTSVETTMSYGPYKMTDYQTDKGMHFVKNENWYGYTDGKHVYVDPVDGLTYPMYQTTEIDCQVVAEVATAKMMFLKGELMGYGLQTEDFDTYRNSEFCYFSPGQTIFFLILNGNMPAIQERENAADFDKTKNDLEMMTLTSFHRAMGLAYDKALFIESQSPADSPAFGLIGNAYIYDALSGATYRGSDIAKQVLCEVYAVDTSKYASLDDAVASITGYDPVAAAEFFKQAFAEGIEKGYITDTDNDGKCDQTIEMFYAVSGSVSEKLTKRLDYMTEKANEAAAGTPFEGKIKFSPSAPLGNAWADNVKAGLVDTVLGGWTGSMMDPFGLIEVYTNPSYQYDAQWFDSTTVDLTLNLGGKDITMNLDEWTKVLNGTVITKDGVDYNFGDGIGAPEDRLTILAGIEKTILLTYNYLPMMEEGSMALLSQKAYYIIEDYNPVMGRGGITYLRYNYNDAEWAAYVASQPDGQLTY